jgi:hypothetical protein
LRNTKRVIKNKEILKGNVVMKNMDLSFLVECAAPVAVKESSLTELVADSFIEYVTKPLGNIKISALTREDFADRPEILAKYFRHDNRPLDRFHIPDISPTRYEELVGDPKKLKNIKNAKLETATKYYIDKIKLASVAKDLNCTVKQLDLTDYIWDERFYVRTNFIENIEVVDEWFRDNSEDDRYSGTAYKSYISEDPRTAILDEELFDNLYSFCVSAIRQRKVMLLGKVDKCLGALRNVMEYTNGFVENPTKQMMATLKNYKEYFEELLTDKDMKEFLRDNNDITVYGNDEHTRSDYIDTYRAVVKGLVSGLDEDIRSFSDLLTGIEDPYLEDIFEVIPTVDYRAWQLDSSGEI